MGISRRKFIGKSLLVTSGGIAAWNNAKGLNPVFTGKQNAKDIKVFIPMPIQIVIDDVGWWSGEDGSKRNEPYRTGINRRHVPADYQAICDLGKALGIRPQAATILCEWDKENICGKVPSATWMGSSWDNRGNVGQWMEEAADIIRSNSKNIELTIHGVGHEFWENGIFTRAEWADNNGVMRSPDIVNMHLDLYAALLDQHNLGPFPESFVPCAFRHSFGVSEGRNISLASILEKRGVKYINTPFSIMLNSKAVQNTYFGFDSGVITVDRGHDQFNWDVFPADPAAPVTGPTIGMHWPNLLHPDPSRNGMIVGKWIKYLQPVTRTPDMMLAPDSVVFRNQLLHNQLTKVSLRGNIADFDFSEKDKTAGKKLKDEIYIKFRSDSRLNFKPEALKIELSVIEENGYLYVIKAERTGPGKSGAIRII
ncbi:MAG TPA: hypothetical protein VK155_16900 [Bacteroidales bacterium]|nr:hypothetical protein [Bacteroidales bacterium]